MQNSLSIHSPEVIKSYFSYNSETGIITRIKGTTKSNGVLTSKGVGQPAGTPDGHGYLSISLFHDGQSQRMLAHRVAWVLYYGVWPFTILDHENRIGSDNRIVNLRLATPSLNAINRADRCQPMTGIREVSIKGKSGTWWRVEIQREGVRKYTHRRNLDDAIAYRDSIIS